MVSDNSPEQKDPPPLTKLSKKALQEMARPYAARAMQITAELMEKADNDSVRLGAAKTILAKVLPDLKATELTGELALDLRNVLRLPDKRPLDTPPQTD